MSDLNRTQIIALTVFGISCLLMFYAIVAAISGIEKVREEQQTARTEACLAAGGMVLDKGKSCRLD